MKLNIQKLKGKIIECGMTHEQLANKMGIHTSTLYRKINTGGLSFSIGEMHKIVNILQLNSQDANEIFLQYHSH